jgi:hypothetical protein
MATEKNISKAFDPGILVHNLNTGERYKNPVRSLVKIAGYYTEAQAFAAAEAAESVTPFAGGVTVSTAVAQRDGDSPRWIVQITEVTYYDPVAVA